MDKNNPTQEKKSKCVNGEKYQYNRFKDTFGDPGRYSDETPRHRDFPLLDLNKKSKKQKKAYLIFVISFAVLSVAFLIYALIFLI